MTLPYINRWAQRTPGKVALIHNDVGLTYAELARSVEATRRQLISQGAPTQGVAAVLAGSLRAAWALALAARALGLTTVMVADVRRLGELGLRGLVCLLTPSDEPPPPSDPVRSGLTHIAVPAAALRAEGLDAAASLVDPQRLGDHILYTSGTTGLYKKLLADSGRQEARDRERLSSFGFTPQTVYHAMDFGLWTGIGFKSVSTVWLAGATVVFDQTETRFANLRRHSPTYTQTLPESLRKIIDASDPSQPPSTTLRLRCGGSLVPLSLAEHAVARISTRFTVGFGPTELTPWMLSDYHTPDDLVWLTPTRPELVEIVDEGGAEVGPGAEGFIRFRLEEKDITEYLDDPEATATAYRGGCFYTKDLRCAPQRRAGAHPRPRWRRLERQGPKARRGADRGGSAAGPRRRRALRLPRHGAGRRRGAGGGDPLEAAARQGRPASPPRTLQDLRPRAHRGLPRVPRTQAGMSKIKRTELRRMVFPD